MSHRPRLFLLAALLFAPLVACTETPDAPGAGDRGGSAFIRDLVITEYESVAVRPPHAVPPGLPESTDRLDPEAEPGTAPRPDDRPGAVRAGRDQACFDAAVEELMGCGLCVHIRCDADHNVGACIACPADVP